MSRFTTILIVALALTGCDRSEGQSPEDQKHQQLQDEGQAWRSLVQSLDTTEEPSARIELLDRFITDYPEHPDIVQAKKMMEDARAQVKNAEAFQELRSKAFDEKDPMAVLSFLALDVAGQATDRALVDEVEPITMPTTNGTRTFEQRLFFTPVHLRGRTRITLTEHAGDLVEKRCDRECVNNAINNLMKATTGEELFAAPGRMNPAAVQALLEKVPATKDAPVLELTGAQLYDLYRPTVRAFARTRDAVMSGGIEEAARKIEGAEPKEIRAFYKSFTKEHDIAKRAELDETKARAFASWWIRRWADGTGPLFDQKLNDVLDTFDPEFTGAEPVEDAGEEK